MTTTEINKENHPDWVVCHTAGCGMTAHIDHALGLNKDQKAHWVLDNDLGYLHFCSKECWEKTYRSMDYPMAPTMVCGCRECTDSHDRYYLGIERYGGGGCGGTYNPSSLGQCDLGFDHFGTLTHVETPQSTGPSHDDNAPCKVCIRRQSPLIPHTRCNVIGHEPSPLGTECEHCAYDAFIASIVGEN